MGQGEAVLCYIDGVWAYFTTQELGQQWGDDWGDAPYQDNAGRPHTFAERDAQRGAVPWRIVKVAWEGPFLTPDAYSNCALSVQDINQKKVPWLQPADWDKHTVTIMAGTTMSVFVLAIRQAGGSTYLPLP